MMTMETSCEQITWETEGVGGRTLASSLKRWASEKTRVCRGRSRTAAVPEPGEPGLLSNSPPSPPHPPGRSARAPTVLYRS